MKKILLAALVASTACFTACSDGPKPTLKTDADTLAYELGMANSPSEEELKQFLASERTGSDSAFVEDFIKGVEDGLAAGRDKKKMAYYAGIQYASQMTSYLAYVEKNVFGQDSLSHLSTKNFLSGFMMGLGGERTHLMVDSVLIDKDKARIEANRRIEEMTRAAKERDSKDAIEAAKAYMAQKEKEGGYQKLPGGTLYKVITTGDGRKPVMGDVVNMEYEGKLTDGKVFDASANHSQGENRTIAMPVGNAIPGFNEALTNMPMGSEWEIIIPYDQAYNDQGNQVIPAFSNLIFRIKLVSFYEAPAQQ